LRRSTSFMKSAFVFSSLIPRWYSSNFSFSFIFGAVRWTWHQQFIWHYSSQGKHPANFSVQGDSLLFKRCVLHWTSTALNHYCLSMLVRKTNQSFYTNRQDAIQVDKIFHVKCDGRLPWCGMVHKEKFHYFQHTHHWANHVGLWCGGRPTCLHHHKLCIRSCHVWTLQRWILFATACEVV